MRLFDSSHAMLGTSAGSDAATRTDPGDFFGTGTACLTIGTDLRFDSADEAALCFPSTGSTDFVDTVNVVKDILTVENEEINTEFNRHTNDRDCNWVVLVNGDLEDFVIGVHFTVNGFTKHGYGSYLFAALFGLERDGGHTYWICSPRRGMYYPFAPQGISTRN